MSKHSWLQIWTLVIIWNPTRRPSLPWEVPREGSYWEGICTETPLGQLSPDFIAFQFMTDPPTHLLILLSFGSWLVQPSNPLPPQPNGFWQMRLLAVEEFACTDRFKVPIWMIWTLEQQFSLCEHMWASKCQAKWWCPLMSIISVIGAKNLTDYKMLQSQQTHSVSFDDLSNNYKILQSA